MYNCVFDEEYLSFYLTTPNYLVNSIIFSFNVGYLDLTNPYWGHLPTTTNCSFLVSESYLTAFNPSSSVGHKVILDGSYFLSVYRWGALLPSATLYGNNGTSQNYIMLDFGYFNVFPYDVTDVTYSVSSSSPDYLTCSWYDIPCHLGNALSYIIYEFPLTKPIYTFFKSILGLIEPIFDFLKLFVDIPYFSAILFLFFFVGLLFFLIR